MKVFISMPMKNRENDEIKRDMQKLFERFLEWYHSNVSTEEINLIDSVVDFPGKSGLFYLSQSLQFMDEADVVLFEKNFQHAKGCMMEFEAAHAYNRGKRIFIELVDGSFTGKFDVAEFRTNKIVIR